MVCCRRPTISAGWGLFARIWNLNAINPQIADWGRHVSDQVGSVSFGWGLFLVTLAIFGIMQAHKWAWLVLWIAGTLTIIYSTFGEYIQFRTFDEVSLYSMIVLIIFLTGMFIPTKLIKEQEKSTVVISKVQRNQ